MGSGWMRFNHLTVERSPAGGELLPRGSGSDFVRGDQRNVLPPVFAIDPKMPVQGENTGSGIQFSHPHEATISMTEMMVTVRRTALILSAR